VAFKECVYKNFIQVEPFNHLVHCNVRRPTNECAKCGMHTARTMWPARTVSF
jgi:hypothetical protein